MAIDFNGTPGDYTYSEDANGKSAEGIVAVGAQSDRNPAAQLAAGGEDRQAGDHGGHLIAHSLGGKNEPCNLDAQAANVNQIDQRGVERDLANLASNPDNTVYVGVHNFNSNGSQRPDATMMTGAVRDNTTGNIDIEHYSFQNASHEEQESWNKTVAQNTEIDSRQDAGMTAEERDLANELCGAEDTVDMSLGNATVTSFDAAVFDAGDQDSASMDSGSMDDSAGTMDGDGDDDFGGFEGAADDNTGSDSSNDSDGDGGGMGM
ncbi:MAG: DNA/RNA non-specific endonuclease [Oscillospiraceae bacterium]|nr:DNA/RNA non-specific endonuclease [Oscillospiraceae bacterium]